MAGDWIPIRKDLPHSNEVYELAEKCQMSPREVVGTLHDLWCWVDSETLDGRIPGCSKNRVALIVNLRPEFLDILSEINWIRWQNGDFYMVNFDTWLGESAKKRLKESRRKRQERKKLPKTPPRPKKPDKMSEIPGPQERESIIRDTKDPKVESIEINSKVEREAHSPPVDVSRNGKHTSGILAAVYLAAGANPKRCTKRKRAEIEKVVEFLADTYPKKADEWITTAVGQFSRWFFEVNRPGIVPEPLWIIEDWEKFRRYKNSPIGRDQQ
jgi:hypothetical protein